MVTELANLGEFYQIVKYLHPIAYPAHHHLADTLNSLKDAQQKQKYWRSCRSFMENSLYKLRVGTNFYIEWVRCVIQQLCQALAMMHSRGIAHLDLSIENIVLHFDPNDAQYPLICKVIDFGRAHCFLGENGNQESYEFAPAAAGVNDGRGDSDRKGQDDDDDDEYEHRRQQNCQQWAKQLDQINFAFNKHPGKTKYMSPQVLFYM